MGDFNELLSQVEKEGIRPYHSSGAELFRDFLNLSGLMEFETMGCKFTWASNPRNGVIIREKLDWILANWAWRRNFPHAMTVALPTVSSDHSPLLLLPVPKNKSGYSFNFEAFWTEHEDCNQIVDQGWNKGVRCEDPWETVLKKLESCKKELMTWQKKTFKRGDEEIIRYKKRLEELMSSGGQCTNGDEIRRVQKHIDELWKREELYWSQRSRLKWLEGGDRNTKFLHASTIHRRGRNRLHRIKNHRGEWVEGKEEIFEAILESFEEVYRADPPTDLFHIGNVLPNIVTSDMNEMLLAPITEEEIKGAIFSLGALKAPGPDGLNGLFYQKNWTSVKEDVCRAVWAFFDGGNIPTELNEVVVALVPKVLLPESINQLRPISCCNFAYKIISKLIVLRLRNIMDQLISPN